MEWIRAQRLGCARTLSCANHPTEPELVNSAPSTNAGLPRTERIKTPLRVRVEKRLSRLSHDAEALMRMQVILNEHPEFEQFIELQNLLNRHGV